MGGMPHACPPTWNAIELSSPVGDSWCEALNLMLDHALNVAGSNLVEFAIWLSGALRL